MLNVVITVVVLVIVLRILMPVLGSPVAGGIQNHPSGRTLSACPNSPNCYLRDFVLGSSQSPAEKPDTRLDRLAALISRQSGMDVVAVNDHYLHATATTPVFGFRDDVEFLWHPEDRKISVRSASRLGHRDLGANQRRVERLGELIAEYL